MIATCMDEPGLIASHIDAQGFVRFAPLGHVANQYLPGSRVRFSNGTEGLVVSQRFDGRRTAPAGDPMFIDVGASSQADCPVQLGDTAAFETSFRELGIRLSGRSLGSRACILSATEALRKLGSTANDIYFVFAAQGQIGSRPLLISSYGIEPDVALTLGPTSAHDFAGSHKQGPSLGKGPVIQISDAGMLSDPRLVSWLVRTAEKNRLPYQREVLPLEGGTDLNIQTSISGVPAGALAVPVRYLGTPVELLEQGDVLRTIELLAALLRPAIRLEA
jgi:endoglucanase